MTLLGGLGAAGLIVWGGVTWQSRRREVRRRARLRIEVVLRQTALQRLPELLETSETLAQVYGELGTHLHPWSSPPFRPEDLAAHTYPHNLPPDLLDRQITELTAAIEENLGVRPTTYGTREHCAAVCTTFAISRPIDRNYPSELGKTCCSVILL